MTLRREAAPLAVVEPHALHTEKLSEHAILLDQELDGVRLPAVHPAGEHREQQPQGEVIGHWPLFIQDGPRIGHGR